MLLKTSPSIKIELEAKKQDLTEKITELKKNSSVKTITAN